MIILKAKKREPNTKNIQVKNVMSDIKSVIYGPKFENVSIYIPYVDFIRAYNTVGTSGLIGVEIDGNVVNCLIHSMDLDPVKNSPTHVDFYVPEKGKKVTAEVTLEFIGESEAVKMGGLLIKVLHEVEVEALPENLPHTISVDISKLMTVNDDIVISDIKTPIGVIIKNSPEDVVASIVLPEEEKEEVQIDLSLIEVAKKGKQEEISE